MDITTHKLAGEPQIYGEGTGELLHRIKVALEAVPYTQERGFNGSAKDPKLCADAIHTVLRKYAEEVGHTPDAEVFMRVTGTEGRKTYLVSYEAGPYEWAIPGSFTVMDATGRLCEPYYSFDLMLYDVE